MITLYVDDVLTARSDITAVTSMKRAFAEKFEMEDCSEAKHFPGLKITQNRNVQALELSQSSYPESVLQRFGMQECRAVCTPVQCNSR